MTNGYEIEIFIFWFCLFRMVLGQWGWEEVKRLTDVRRRVHFFFFVGEGFDGVWLK